MKIISKEEANHVDKPTGIKTDYFLFPEYEVHYNEQPAGTEQDWHHHEKISETVLITQGEMKLSWKEGSKVKSEMVSEGDLIKLENSPHSFKNESSGVAKFIVIKQVLKGENNRELFKNDKVGD